MNQVMAPESARRQMSGQRATVLLVAAILVGLALRLALVAMTEAGLGNVDETHYYQLATSLYEHMGFASEAGQPTSLRPPLYPWFLSTIWVLNGGPSLMLVRLVQAALSMLTAVGVYLLGSRMFDRRSGLVAAAICCFYPSLLFAGVTILTETLFTFLLVLFALACERCLANRSHAWAAAAGTLLALAALTRSVVWPFGLFVAPLLSLLTAAVPTDATRLAHAPVRDRVRGAVGLAAVFLACNVVVLAPWAVRNTRLQHVPTIVDTMSGFNLWMANYAGTPPDRMWASIDQGGARDLSAALLSAFPSQHLTEGEKDRWGRQQAFRYMREHPVTTLRRSIVKFADFWGLERELPAALRAGVYHPPAWASFPIIFATAIAYPPVMALAVLGLFLAVRRGVPTHVIIIALVLFVCAVHIVVFGHSRYRLPLMPFFFVYAGAAVADRSWRRLTTRRVATLLPLVVFGSLVVIWAHELLVRDWARIGTLFGV